MKTHDAFTRLPRCAAAALMAAGLALAAAALPAAARDPLSQDGSTAIPQRVLTRPGAEVVDAPGGAAVVERPTPFTLYYVFTREEHEGAEWIEVGPNREGETSGWLPAERAVDWKQTMVLSFTNPAGRLPVLFFDTRERMIDFVEDERMPILAPEYVEAARRGAPPEGSGVVAIEPELDIDAVEQFYLLPILDAEEVFLSASMRRSKIFEIASIPLETPAVEAPPAEPPPIAVGVVFVIDTTLSMQPYIDRTRKTVRTIVETLRASQIGENVSFGMVGFRDDPGGQTGIDYTARVFAPLQRDFDADAFLDAITSVTAASVSTRGFNEDGLAGVATALDLEAWKDFQGRFIIYIGDSGVREGGGEGGSATGLTVDQVAARARGEPLEIAISTILLKTAAGTAYHAGAEDQLRRLAIYQEGIAPAYYAVEAATPETYGPVVDTLTGAIVSQVETIGGERAAQAPPGGAGGRDCSDPANVIDCLGYAMRLAWLGRLEGTQAPDVIEAWVPQAALNDPINTSSFDVNILLTRDQVNNLYARLGLVLSAADRLMGSDPGLLFDTLSTVLAEAANDPTMLVGLDPTQNAGVQVEDLPNLGVLLGEYFGHLPFRTPLMDTTREDWATMDGGERDRVLTSVRSAREMLRYYYEDSESWIALHPAATDGERVFPLPFEVLP